MFSQYGQFWTSVLLPWRGRNGIGGKAGEFGTLARSVHLDIGGIGALFRFGNVIRWCGGGLYEWLKHVAPVIGFMRFPIKFIVLVAFALPLLAAFGMSWFPSFARVKSGQGSAEKFSASLVRCWPW